MPYWKDMPFSEPERQAMYGLGSNDFVLTKTIEEADLVIIPMSWNYYVNNTKVPIATGLLEKARRKGKKVLMHTTGDRGVTVPFDYAYVLRLSGYKSARKPHEFVQPVFFDDPIATWFEGESPSFRHKSERPVIGFCGQADSHWARDLFLSGQQSIRNLLTHFKLRSEDAQSLYPPTRLRRKVLAQLHLSAEIKPNFIVRNKYRAGAISEADRHRTTIDFYRNIQESDYTVCVRGGGNFSKRFYETLAMGRIPLFINTDCNLPFEEEIDWRQLCLWIESEDIKSLAKLLITHYNSFEDHGFIDLQKKCRKIWDDWLSFAAFHRQFANKLLHSEL
jgi:hypothetical protein